MFISLGSWVGHCDWEGIDLGARWPWIGKRVFCLSWEQLKAFVGGGCLFIVSAPMFSLGEAGTSGP